MIVAAKFFQTFVHWFTYSPMSAPSLDPYNLRVGKYNIICCRILVGFTYPIIYVESEELFIAVLFSSTYA